MLNRREKTGPSLGRNASSRDSVAGIFPAVRIGLQTTTGISPVAAIVPSRNHAREQ